jgi:hypothetical protein
MHRTTLILLCLLTVSCATINKQEDIDYRYSQNIVGSWTCELVHSESGVIITLKTNLDYYANNTYTVFNDRQDELVKEDMVIRVLTSGIGSWSIENGYRLETLSNLKLLHYTDPAFSDLFDIQSLTPIDTVSSSRILELTDAFARFELQEGVAYDCNKVTVK